MNNLSQAFGICMQVIKYLQFRMKHFYISVIKWLHYETLRLYPIGSEFVDIMYTNRSLNWQIVNI